MGRIIIAWGAEKEGLVGIKVFRGFMQSGDSTPYLFTSFGGQHVDKPRRSHLANEGGRVNSEQLTEQQNI